MAPRKHTLCRGCAEVAKCRQLELMWRLDGAGPWMWVSAWTCAACRSSTLENLGHLFGQLVLWDG